MGTTTLGELIRQSRIDLELSQTQLGDRIGKSQRWVSNVENGQVAQPRLPVLRSLADVLRISIADLVLAAGYAESREAAQRLAIESATFMIDEDSPEGRLIPLIRQVHWDARTLQMMETQLEVLIRGSRGEYYEPTEAKGEIG